MAKKKRIQVIVKAPDEKYGHVEEIENSLGAFQAKVDGYIQTYPVIDTATGVSTVAVMNEEGLLLNLPKQCNLPFVGTIFIVGTEGDRFTDCPISLEFWKTHFFPLEEA